MREIPQLNRRRPVVIVGGGPSAAGTDFAALCKRCYVVAINDALKHIPDAHMVFSADGSWAMRRIGPVSAHRGTIVLALDPETKVRYAQQFVRLRRVDGDDLASDPWVIPHGGNSGFAALNFIQAVGVKRIGLLGFDMTERGHWHGGYDWSRTARHDAFDEWIPSFQKIAPALQRRGVDVVNFNPYSGIKAFRYAAMGDFLEWT